MSERDYYTGGIRIPTELKPPWYMDDRFLGIAFAVYFGVIIGGFAVVVILNLLGVAFVGTP